jgi:excisionase family DNA binding protein
MGGVVRVSQEEQRLMTKTALASGEPPARLTYSIPEASHVLGLSETTLWSLIRRGVIRPVRIGRRTLVPRSEVDRLLADDDEVWLS